MRNPAKSPLHAWLMLLTIDMAPVPGIAGEGTMYHFAVERTPVPAAEAVRVTDLAEVTLRNNVRLPAHAADLPHAAGDDAWTRD